MSKSNPRSRFLAPLALALPLAAALLVPGEARAQIFTVGLSGGAATDASESFDSGNFEARYADLRFSLEAEPGVIVRMRIGRIDIPSPDKTTSPDVRAERIGVDVEYRQRISFYYAGMFLGGGYYRFRSDDERLAPWDDGGDHWGWWGGVDGWFPLTHDLIFIPEIMFERINQESPRTFGRVGLGLEFRF